MAGDDVETMEGEEASDKGVKEPNDTDVLCGRGGAALRHPGNQTYRRLVNLNKGLYITCLKTEKLKISRSIVAAIREQNGRFLEKGGDKGLWMDIGDKKAIEKTSQALREGQPKLRQKIVEMGGGATGTAAFIEQQFGANGIYHPEMAAAAGGGPGFGMSPHAGIPAMPPQQAAIAAQAAAMGSARNLNAQNLEMMPPPARQPQAVHSGADLYAQSLLSQQAQHVGGAQNGGAATDMDLSFHRTMQMRPSAVKRNSFNAQDLSSNRSLLSDFSAFGGAGSAHDMLYGSPKKGSQPSLDGGGAMSFSGHGQAKQGDLDRRRVFANSKYFRKPSQPDLQLQDGMPDINMIESNPSLFSDLSGRGTSHHQRPEAFGSVSSALGSSGFGSTGSGSGVGKVLDSGSNAHAELLGGVLGGGSRHSIMSGLSRISDNSEVNSIFSDLSKKIGNVSTRSIAMSEISGIDDAIEEDDNERDSPSFGTFATELKTERRKSTQSIGGMEIDFE